jgi:hypothetical protein
MVGVADKIVLVREIEISEDAVEKFGAIVGVEEIPVSGVNVNCQADIARSITLAGSRTRSARSRLIALELAQ